MTTNDADPTPAAGDGLRTVRIARLDARGAGVAEAGAPPIRGALPDERARVDPDTGALTEILSPSGHRVRAPCAFARDPIAPCGGCALQHAHPEFIADWKRSLLVDALARRGVDADVLTTETSPPRSRRRAVFSAVRTKKGVRLGFYAARSETVVSIDDCWVAAPELMAARDALSELARLAAARQRPVQFAVAATETGLDVQVRAGKTLDLERRQQVADWAEANDVARIAWTDEIVAERRPPLIRFGRTPVSPPPGAFLQATAHGEAALTSRVCAGLAGAARAADLFSGCGTFALPLAERMEVLAVDGDGALIDALDRAWRGGDGLRRLVARRRDLFRRPLEAEELKGIDAAVVDPPRAGAEAQMRAIAQSGIARVAAVSCNPLTFARDAQILIEAGFKISPVTPIDQFLWSPHVEICAIFTR